MQVALCRRSGCRYIRVCYSSLLKRLSSASKIPFMRVVMCTATSAMVMDMSLLLPTPQSTVQCFGHGPMAVVQSHWLSCAELLRPLVQHHQAQPHGILAAIRYLLEGHYGSW